MRIKTILITLLVCVSLSAQKTDRDMLIAYEQKDMTVWQEYVDSFTIYHLPFTPQLLLYDYGFCGFMVDSDKVAAKPYVEQFRRHVELLRGQLPVGHYEMYMSAVYVYEMRLKVSIHPLKAMSLAKEAVSLAPEDPLTLSYYGTCQFYAPKPFGSKKDALKWFEQAEVYFRAPEYRDCWLREATDMYIRLCREKYSL